MGPIKAPKSSTPVTEASAVVPLARRPKPAPVGRIVRPNAAPYAEELQRRPPIGPQCVPELTSALRFETVPTVRPFLGETLLRASTGRAAIEKVDRVGQTP